MQIDMSNKQPVTGYWPLTFFFPICRTTTQRDAVSQLLVATAPLSHSLSSSIHAHCMMLTFPSIWAQGLGTNTSFQAQMSCLSEMLSHSYLFSKSTKESPHVLRKIKQHSTANGRTVQYPNSDRNPSVHAPIQGERNIQPYIKPHTSPSKRTSHPTKHFWLHLNISLR